MTEQPSCLLTPTTAATAGVSRHRLVGAHFQSVMRGVHAPIDVDLDLRLRCQAAMLVVPPDSVFSHWTAASLLGGPVMRQLPWLQVINARARIRRPEVRGARRELSPGETTERHGFPVTTAERSFLDLAEKTALAELVAFGDWMLNVGIASPSSLDKAICKGAGHRGVVRARAGALLLDGLAGSPMESILRVRLLDAGFPPPVVNGEVFDAVGGWIACPDLSYPHAKIAIEYEGAHHRGANQFRRDTLRDQLLAGLGWVVLRATIRDLRPGSTTLTDSLRALLATRG